jgi:hypothetical protein
MEAEYSVADRRTRTSTGPTRRRKGAKAPRIFFAVVKRGDLHRLLYAGCVDGVLRPTQTRGGVPLGRSQFGALGQRHVKHPRFNRNDRFHRGSAFLGEPSQTPQGSDQSRRLQDFQIENLKRGGKDRAPRTWTSNGGTQRVQLETNCRADASCVPAAKPASVM